MTSRRRRKRAAQQQGLTAAESELAALLREVLAALRWVQVLGWGNQYLLQQHLQITPEERDKVMRAAAATVERDGAMQQWQQRLQAIEAQLAAIDAALRGGRERPAAGGGAAGGAGMRGDGGGEQGAGPAREAQDAG